MLVLRDAVPADALRPEDRSRRYRFDSNDPHKPWTVVATIDERVRGFATVCPSRSVFAPPSRPSAARRPR